MTLREVLEKNINNYVAIETATTKRIVHLGSEWLDKYEANIYYDMSELMNEAYVEETGADDYDIYVAM